MSFIYDKILSEKGYKVWLLASESADNHILSNQLILKGVSREAKHAEFIDTLKQYKVDLLIYQNGITPSNIHILRWSREANIKIITVIHNTLRGMYGVGGHPKLSAIRPEFAKNIVNKCVNYYFIHKYGKLHREEFELSDKVVLLSDKFREEITYFTGWRDFSKFSAIFNPLTIQAPKAINAGKNKTVLHVGLANMSKRQDLLLKIWSIVEQERNDWTLKIVGDGSNKPNLERLAGKLKLKHVEFLGYQSPEKYYEEASIFCLTSAFESFGLVLVESMAFGCVPMAFNSFETACDIIDDGVNGKLIKPFNLDEYAREMIYLMDNYEQRQKMALNAIEKSKAFNIDAIGKQWYDLIAELQANNQE